MTTRWPFAMPTTTVMPRMTVGMETDPARVDLATHRLLITACVPAGPAILNERQREKSRALQRTPAKHRRWLRSLGNRAFEADPWKLHVKSIELGGHQQLATPNEITIALFAPTAVDVCVTFSGLKKGERARLYVRSSLDRPAQVFAAWIVS